MNLLSTDESHEIYKTLFGFLILCVHGNPLTGTFANSEDPDEMQHNAAFHQGLYTVVKVKRSISSADPEGGDRGSRPPLKNHKLYGFL